MTENDKDPFNQHKGVWANFVDTLKPSYWLMVLYWAAAFLLNRVLLLLPYEGQARATCFAWMNKAGQKYAMIMCEKGYAPVWVYKS